MRIITLFLCLLTAQFALGQSSLYYPPITNENWDTVDPTSLGWCQKGIDSVLQFLERKNSKSVIVLHKGKLAIEHYFDDYGRDSIWYWASSGKSLMAFLVGMAQDEGLLDIEDSTSHHLGTGWTSLTAAQEGKIKIRHQLSMNTGLDDEVADVNCLTSSCLTYRTDPEARWAYYNAPYRLLQDVVANASGLTINQFTNQRMFNRIGMRGAWFNYVRFGRARDMARFGLLMLGEGIWDGDTLLHDQSYFQAMITPSQALNSSYGYLWWLNGQGSHMLPTVQLVFPSDLAPAAPNDMYSALGKNDQKIYVVPSLELVVVRQGEDAGESKLAVSSFDNQLWEYLNDVFCNSSTSIDRSFAESELQIFPNPAKDRLTIQWTERSPKEGYLSLLDLQGKIVREQVAGAGSGQVELSLDNVPDGIYVVEVRRGGEVWREKVVVW
ncbi:MAG: serine hydrolase [Bacteroidota bacterium]